MNSLAPDDGLKIDRWAFLQQVLLKGLWPPALKFACYNLSMRVLSAFFLSVFLGGCSSSSSNGKYMWPDPDEASRAPAAAYAADGMYFRKEMPDRRNHKPWEFYYKHCSMAGDKGYISKTSYDCSGPYY